MTVGHQLSDSPIVLAQFDSSMPRELFISSIILPYSFTQRFTSKRETAADSYIQDLQEFEVLWAERVEWLRKNTSQHKTYYFVTPCNDNHPTIMETVVFIADGYQAACYRKHFYP